MTPQERLRQHQRSLEKAQRELDRERTKLEQQEKKLISDIKKSAKAGQMSACKVMAKDLVRTRRHVQKFYQMKTQLQGIALRIQVLDTSHIYADDLLADCAKQRSNGSGNERSYKGIILLLLLPTLATRYYESEHESSRNSTYSNGIRTRERYDGSATGNDGRRNRRHV